MRKNVVDVLHEPADANETQFESDRSVRIFQKLGL